MRLQGYGTGRFRLMGEIKDMVSVDLGCGSRKINSFFKGVDIQKTLSVDFVADMENLNCFSDSSVTVVVSRRALQHVSNDVQALKEINRILTVDGLVFIEVASFLNALASIIVKRLGFSLHNHYSVFHVYTRKSLKALIAESGLVLVCLGSVPTRKPLFRNLIVVATKSSSVNVKQLPSSTLSDKEK